MRQGWMIMVLIGMVAASCEIKPQPISYGTDVCQFCSMTIVDMQHAAEVVTKKGKAFKYDSIECLLNARGEFKENAIALYLCNHYTGSGELIPMEEASFLISEALPSPMGAYLTAFDTKMEALEIKDELGGDLYNWEELLKHWEDHYVYYK